MNTSPTTEERIWAVLSHLSALAFGMGILLPIIGWSEQRRKSKYASFQCLQALGYQSLGYTVWILLYLLILILLFFVFAFTLPTGNDFDRAIDLWSGIFIIVAFGLLGIYLLFPIIAAIACGLGRDFRYPILGHRLARYLGYDDADLLMEGHEEHWTVAMGHFSVIIPLWGILAPVTTWILGGKQNPFLGFQSIQTTIYQAFVNAIYMVAMFFYFFGLIALFAMTGLEGTPDSTSPIGMAGLVIFLLSMLITVLIMLVVPLFHILGQWAGYRTLKGDDYRYPVVGRLVANRSAKHSVAKEGSL